MAHFSFSLPVIKCNLVHVDVLVVSNGFKILFETIIIMISIFTYQFYAAIQNFLLELHFSIFGLLIYKISGDLVRIYKQIVKWQ